MFGRNNTNGNDNGKFHVNFLGFTSFIVLGKRTHTLCSTKKRRNPRLAVTSKNRLLVKPSLIRFAKYPLSPCKSGVRLTDKKPRFESVKKRGCPDFCLNILQHLYLFNRQGPTNNFKQGMLKIAHADQLFFAKHQNKQNADIYA